MLHKTRRREYFNTYPEAEAAFFENNKARFISIPFFFAFPKGQNNLFPQEVKYYHPSNLKRLGGNFNIGDSELAFRKFLFKLNNASEYTQTLTVCRHQ